MTPSGSASSTTSEHRPTQSSQTAHEDEDEEVDSLPSLSTDEIDSDSDDGQDNGRRRRRGGQLSDSDAQREWERSLQQLQLLLTMVLVPFVGKYLGRKFAYWSEFPRP